jgi:hypothetical protein
MHDQPAVHDQVLSFDEVAARRRLRLVHEAGIEAPCGELHFEASEWLREVELDSAWRPSVMKVARVLARAFDATGTITLTHRVIAKRAKLRGTATEDALRELDQAGWLGRDQQLRGRGRGAVYTAFFASYMGAEAPERGPEKDPEKGPAKRHALTRGRAERSLTVQEEELISDSSSLEEGSTLLDVKEETRSAAKAAPEPLENQPAFEGDRQIPASSKHVAHNVPEDLSTTSAPEAPRPSEHSAAEQERLRWLDTLEHERELAGPHETERPPPDVGGLTASAVRKCVACGRSYRARLDECPNCRCPANA